MPQREIYRGNDVGRLQAQVRSSENEADKWRKRAFAAQNTLHREDGRAAVGVQRGADAAPRANDKYTTKAILDGMITGIDVTDASAKQGVNAIERLIQLATESDNGATEVEDLHEVLDAIEPLQKRLKTSAEPSECPVTLGELTKETVVFGKTCLHAVSEEAARHIAEGPSDRNKCPVCRAEGWMTTAHLDLLAVCRKEIFDEQNGAGQNAAAGGTGEEQLEALLANGTLALVPAPFDPLHQVIIAFGPNGCAKKSEETDTKKYFNMYTNRHIFTSADPKFRFDKEKGKVWHRPIAAPQA